MNGHKEKNFVAVSSVFAAIFLTGFKLIVGITTNSLGILSEALHSTLDLVAAVITMFAVRYSDKPADSDHNFGHGKIENISALIETILLFFTCGWIIYEAVERLIGGNFHIEVTIWSFIVVLTSILVDFGRSRSLKRVAEKYDSQALAADALHFQTDIWSSLVVLFGLIGAGLSYKYADSVSAIFVALIVFVISYRLGKRTFDVLIDRAPDGMRELIEEAVQGVAEVTRFHDIKIRVSGAMKLIELNIHVDRNMTIEAAHNISHQVEAAIVGKIGKAQVLVHTEPEMNEGA
jgi:cation diffusion facilitator family transporter